jgi:hypothetical protein
MISRYYVVNSTGETRRLSAEDAGSHLASVGLTSWVKKGLSQTPLRMEKIE